MNRSVHTEIHSGSKVQEKSSLVRVLDLFPAQTQYGFRRAPSTLQPLYIARRIQDAAEQSGSDLFLGFLDWQKAFDKINHSRMFEALDRMNTPPKMLRVLRADYNHPTFQVEFDQFKSGIRQGCPLSPYLFVTVMSVMFSDFRPEHHRSLSHGQLDHISFMEILYADDTLLFTKNTRAMNRLLHAVEDESQYYGLSLNKSKCTVISTSGRHDVRFRDGTRMPHEDHVSYLGWLLTRRVDNRSEVESRISATMAVWKRMHLCFKNASCPVRWKPIVYNSMIRSKHLYGLETVELTQSLLSRLESFQLRGLRKILKIPTTFIDRRNTNAEVYRRANAAAASRDNPSPKLTWCIEKCLHELDDEWPESICHHVGSQSAS